MKPLHLKEEILFGFHLKVIPVGYPFLVCEQFGYLHLATYHIAFGTNIRSGKAWYQKQIKAKQTCEDSKSASKFRL